MNTLEFLSSLYENAEQGYTQVFSLPAKAARAIPASDLGGLHDVLAAMPAANDLYFSPGLSAAPRDERLSTDDIIGIPALWVDIDIKNEHAHAKHNLPASIADAMEILPDNMAPSIVVHSGYGLHAWWLLRECWYFDTPAEFQQAKALLHRLHTFVKERADLRGWHMDATFDICRVMRLPGTLNYKMKRAPIPATVIEHCDLRYDPSELDDILPQVDASTGKRIRKSRFERRETDGPAASMLANCAFLQYAQLEAKTLSYQEWLAALTNVVRASDGIGAAHALSALDTARYDQLKTDKKIDEVLADMHPHGCDYIRSLGFKGCPDGGCGVKAPCGWSLGSLPKSIAMVRSISIPTPESVYQPEVLGALALLQKQNPVEYDKFLQKCKGQLNINTLRKELKQARAAAAGFEVHDGAGAAASDPSQDAPIDDETAAVSGVWLRDTVPDAPLNLKLPRKTNTEAWVFKDTCVGVRRVTQTGETFNRASYAPILITERIYNIDTGTEKAKVAFKSRRGWRNILLPKTTIFSGKGVMQLANSGMTLNEDMAKHLAKWLSALEAANVDIIPEKVGVSKLGWRSNETEFILPGVDTSYTLDAGSPDVDGFLSALAPMGDFDAWRAAMGHLRAKTRARFILATSFAAPLLKILGQRTFLVHNWGTTADGKTATLQAAMSVWGKPDELYRTFDSTKASIEKTAELFTDLPLGINEYEVVNDRYKNDVDNLVYMIGEGKGRGRANKDGTMQKASTWRTIAIMNGENPITRPSSKGGILTRVIEIHGGPLKDDEAFASELYRVLARNHGHAGRVFIQQLLAADHEELRNTYNRVRAGLRDAYAGKMEAHIDAISCVVLADYLASEWIFGLDKETAGQQAINMGSDILGEMITKAEASESERAWDWLQDWIAANIHKIQSDYSPGNQSYGTILGYSDAEHIYLIKGELSNAMRDAGFSPEKIYRRWADEDRIPVAIRTNGQRDYGIKRERIGGVQPWLIRIAK